MAERYDLIVIGGGPGGYVAAIRGAQKGLRTALVEKQDLGGTCLNRGCIPTKALLHATHLYSQLVDGEVFGILAGTPGYDMEKIHARKDEVVTQLRGGVASLLQANGVAVFEGLGKVISAGKVQVQPQEGEASELAGERILVAVGAAPIRPPIPGADLPGVLVSDDLLEGPVQNPGSIVIIGGGVIGVEMASIYNNLGTQVTIIELADRLLPMLDKEISQNLAMIFKKRGIAVHAGSMVQEITKGESGLSVKFQGKAGEAVAEGEAVLLSTGRKPSLAGLFEGTLPKTDDRGGIIVDERYETSIPGIFAIGDCVSGNMQLAHEASAQGTNAVAIMAGDHPEMNMSLIPSCVYTDPEIATVGLSVDEAKKADRPIKTSKYVMSGNGKTMIEKGERGFMKLIFDEETEVLLGASFMCSRATDLVGVITALIGTKVTATQLASIIYPHPTFCEGLGEAVESLFGMAVHVAPPRR